MKRDNQTEQGPAHNKKKMKYDHKSSRHLKTNIIHNVLTIILLITKLFISSVGENVSDSLLVKLTILLIN